MLKFNITSEKLPENFSSLDPSIISLTLHLNCLPGIQVIETKEPKEDEILSIHFNAKTFRGIFFLILCLDFRYCKDPWEVRNITATHYVLESKDSKSNQSIKGSKLREPILRLLEGMDYQINNVGRMLHYFGEDYHKDYDVIEI